MPLYTETQMYKGLLRSTPNDGNRKRELILRHSYCPQGGSGSSTTPSSICVSLLMHKDVVVYHFTSRYTHTMSLEKNEPKAYNNSHALFMYIYSS